MEELIQFQNNLLSQVNNNWYRYLYHLLKTEERLLGIKGLRGVGKTTILLQYLAFGYAKPSQGLYITIDHPYFFNNTLLEVADEWHKNNGRLLLIDEVHKYPNWSRELKLIYDGYPDMHIIFTSSSALDLYRGESDLSRRLITQNLNGLSFREYLSLMHRIELPVLNLEDILNYHSSITKKLVKEFKPIHYFVQYLKEGYFPFIVNTSTDNLTLRLIQMLNTVLESDLSYIEGFSQAQVAKIKKLLAVIAESAPFEPNISKIASKLQLGRNTVMLFLKNLHDAHILRLINQPNRHLNALQKPDKIYFENTNLAYALQPTANIGAIREIFFSNQLVNGGHSVSLATKGDFIIDSKYVIEVGGKNKDTTQIKGIENAYLAIDNIEHGFSNKIPLWLFGLLYKRLGLHI